MSTLSTAGKPNEKVRKGHRRRNPIAPLAYGRTGWMQGLTVCICHWALSSRMENITPKKSDLFDAVALKSKRVFTYKRIYFLRRHI